MDCSMLAPKTCVLKVNIHCPECEKKVKKLLQKINGVHSIGIDAEQEKVTVFGTVDSHTLLMALGKAGKKAELLWERCSAMNNHDQNAQPEPIHGIHDQHMNVQVDQLHQLSQMKRLKQVELTHSKTVKMSFSGHKDDLNHKNDCHGTNGAAPPCPCGGHDGGSCGSGSHVMKQIPHGCCEIDASTSCAGPSRARSMLHGNCHGCEPPPVCGCTPAGPSRPSQPSNHFAPPGPPRTARTSAYQYPNVFSDGNPNSCSLM